MKRIVGIALLSLFVLQCKTGKKGGGESNAPAQPAQTASGESTPAAPPSEVASQIQADSIQYAQGCDSSLPSCEIAKGLASASASDVTSQVVNASPEDVAAVQQAVIDNLPPAPTGGTTTGGTTETPTASTPTKASTLAPGYTNQQIFGITMMAVGGLAVVGGLGAVGLKQFKGDYETYRKAVIERIPKLKGIVDKYWSEAKNEVVKSELNKEIGQIDDSKLKVFSNTVELLQSGIDDAEPTKVENAKTTLKNRILELPGNLRAGALAYTQAALNSSVVTHATTWTQGKYQSAMGALSEVSTFIQSKTSGIGGNAMSALTAIGTDIDQAVTSRAPRFAGAIKTLASAADALQIKATNKVKDINKKYGKGAFVAALGGALVLGGAAFYSTGGASQQSTGMGLAGRDDQALATYVDQLGQHCLDAGLCHD